MLVSAFVSALVCAPLLAQAAAEVRATPVLSAGPHAFASWSEYLESPAFRNEGWRCGTPVLAGAPDSVLPTDCGLDATAVRPEYAPEGHRVFRIPVVVHVLIATNGQGALTDARVRNQINVLNEDFRALPGTSGANGTDTRIEFYLAQQDPQGNPSTGITRTVNDAWFQDSGAYYDALAWDPARYLNIFTNSASGALGYVPGLPQSGLAGTNQDRVVLLWAAVGRNAPIGPPYDLGRTATHEVGHYLGLFHTFELGCGGTDCYSSGDLICDTAPEAAPVFGCPTTSASCGVDDPVHNYMDYTDDACYEEFTPEQANRMRCTISYWRAGLDESCASAAIAVRTGGLNENVLAGSAPILGSSLGFTLTAPGRTSAMVFAYARPAARTLRNGMVLLVDELSTPFFVRSFALPAGTLTLNVPNVTSLCGLTAHAQAALFGGVPWALTNALDLTLGR